MRIKKILLYNVGPYIGKNVFELSSSEEKNIVLIGGKNGAGKTTFFNSIKTGLYGCRVWGFAAPGKEYFTFIENLLNSNLQYYTKATGYVEIDLEFNDGKQLDIYRLHREWVKTKKNISETFTVYKNGCLIGEDEKQNFVNYLLSIIPPDMFNLYFFDGESIADFFLGSNGSKNFRNAFLKLYGLDTLSLMVENFERFFRKRDGKDNANELYKKAKENVNKCETELNSLKSLMKDYENSLDLEQIKLQSLINDYSKSGGISLADWKEIITNISKEEANRESINRTLKELANDYLPFVIIRKQLKILLSHIADEQEYKKHKAVVDLMQDSNMRNAIDDFFAKNNIHNVTGAEFLNYIGGISLLNSEHECLFDLSDAQANRLTAQIYAQLKFDPQTITQNVRLLSKSLSASKKLREKLTSSNIDGYENYSAQKEAIEKSINDYKIKIEKLNAQIEDKERQFEQYQAEFKVAREAYEKLLKNKSISELSSRAIAAYTLLEEELVEKQGKLLQIAFMKYFTAIINKNNFLDGIVIDKNINAIPYKLVEVSYSEIDNYLNANAKTRFLELFDSSYLAEINKLRMGIEGSILLPSPIVAPFSQGEKQVYIMSLYLALLKTSNNDIPFFIDTPFARIDSNHRARIVEEFFTKLSNQMFILSTDEEIVGEYKKQIESKISDEFVLSINNYGETKVEGGKYFEE